MLISALSLSVGQLLWKLADVSDLVAPLLAGDISFAGIWKVFLAVLPGFVVYAVGALMYNPAVGDWYTSAALMEPLLNFNPDNTGQAMHERIEHVSHLIDAIHVDSAANPHAHYALKRISATIDKCRLRLYISDTSLHSEIPYAVSEYLQEIFDLKREYLRLWDQENGDFPLPTFHFAL